MIVRVVLASAVLALVAVSTPCLGADGEATWASIRPDLFGDKPIVEDQGFVALGAPTRAEDAALVPIDIHLGVPPGDARRIKAVTLVVDENPSPLVARIDLGEGTARFDLSTRIRVNAYSFVRAVAETSDGALHMTKAYVKAAGGCSAPAVKDPAEAKANAGKMRFRVFADSREAQIQIRHPNNSGMQMNQVTRLYTPAWFVQALTVTQGERTLFSMEGGISLSEDPTFRFTYEADGRAVTAAAVDTDGNHFRQVFAAEGF
jgi:sulfur-oxidizing protein SoxY